MAATVMQFRLVCAEMQILQKHVTMGLKWSVYPPFSPVHGYILHLQAESLLPLSLIVVYKELTEFEIGLSWDGIS